MNKAIYALSIAVIVFFAALAFGQYEFKIFGSLSTAPIQKVQDRYILSDSENIYVSYNEMGEVYETCISGDCYSGMTFVYDNIDENVWTEIKNMDYQGHVAFPTDKIKAEKYPLKNVVFREGDSSHQNKLYLFFDVKEDDFLTEERLDTIAVIYIEWFEEQDTTTTVETTTTIEDETTTTVEPNGDGEEPEDNTTGIILAILMGLGISVTAVYFAWKKYG